MARAHHDDIFDWNTVGTPSPLRPGTFDLLDETLRDGVQSPSVVDPRIGDKIELLHVMVRLGIGVVNIGLPGAGGRATEDARALAAEIAAARLPIAAHCAARTIVKDVVPVAAIAHATGVPLEVYTFTGSSPVRLFAEDWTIDDLLRNLEQSTRFAVAEGLPVCLVTEDTTRAPPVVLERLFRAAFDLGVRRLCLTDTVGHATPHGVRQLFAWTVALVRAAGVDVQLDWHGHNDRGLSLANALRAIECGASRIHGTALGIGERVGNAPMDQILVNLKLAGAWPHDLSELVRYCELAARACRIDIPPNYPVAGRDAFRTATGVHAAAILKARRKGDQDLADRVYSSVAASAFGRVQEIEVGHMSGLWNVMHWLERHGVPYEDELARTILACAKEARGILSDTEIWAVIREQRVTLAAK